MPLTQQEIAQQLGVSRSLVSRALRGTAEDIGAAPATIQRIQREAARRGYQPSAAALSLRGERTRTLGIVVRDFDDPYFGRLIGELQSVAAAAAYSLVLTGCREGAQLDLAALLKYRLDGLIIAGSEFVPAGLAEFTERGLPVAQIGTGESRTGVFRVAMDEADGLRQLLRHLVERGHREIGYIGDGTPAKRRREETLKSALRAEGLPVRTKWFTNTSQPPTESPTALIAADDRLAQSTLRILFERGVRVPVDVSLAGVDDIPSARMTIPALTTIRQPMREMVRAAFEHVTAEKAAKRREILVKPELVVRESCAPPTERRAS